MAGSLTVVVSGSASSLLTSRVNVSARRGWAALQAVSAARVLFLDARRLKALGLDGTDPAYEEWLRENNYQQSPQSN